MGYFCKIIKFSSPIIRLYRRYGRITSNKSCIVLFLIYFILDRIANLMPAYLREIKIFSKQILKIMRWNVGSMGSRWIGEPPAIFVGKLYFVCSHISDRITCCLLLQYLIVVKMRNLNLVQMVVKTAAQIKMLKKLVPTTFAILVCNICVIVGKCFYWNSWFQIWTGKVLKWYKHTYILYQCSYPFIWHCLTTSPHNSVLNQ